MKLTITTTKARLEMVNYTLKKASECYDRKTALEIETFRKQLVKAYLKAIKL